MADISSIDKNFQAAVVDGRETAYYDTATAPFVFEGLAWNDRPYYRLPGNFTSAEVSEGALFLANHTAGCNVRFKTDSPFLTIRAKLVHSNDMNHMPRCGSAGFDLYVKNGEGKFIFQKAVQPNRDEVNVERLLYPQAPGGMQEYLLNFPLYGGVEKVEIGVAPGPDLQPPTPHKIKKPILFYGSSITQGGCASRPGNAYTSQLCRKLDATQINLGFSGSGKGDAAVARAIAELDLSCFVMDYDHNAPDPEHLEKTHEPFFKMIREKNPDLPILILSLCDFHGLEHQKQRREIIRKTYENAIAAGDQHVAFIDGELLWGTTDRDACTVDGCHPNDLGFYRMAETVYPVLKELLETAK